VVLLLGIGIIGILIFSVSQKSADTTPIEKGVVYYTGPKYNFRTKKWVDSSGQVVPRPVGQAEPNPEESQIEHSVKE
jgi:hypothetical protein